MYKGRGVEGGGRVNSCLGIVIEVYGRVVLVFCHVNKSDIPYTYKVDIKLYRDPGITNFGDISNYMHGN